MPRHRHGPSASSKAVKRVDPRHRARVAREPRRPTPLPRRLDALRLTPYLPVFLRQARKAIVVALRTCQVTFNAVGGITLDITSTRCDVLDVQLQHIIASGTVTGPLFTNLSSGFLGDFRCPAWSGGFCTRRSGDAVFSTWTSSVSINVPLGGQFSLKVDAVAGNTKTSAIGSVTCPKAF